MRMQRNLVSADGQIVFSVAALQHGFPRLDIQIGQTRGNPIRSFAATVLSVSHADKDETALAVGALAAVATHKIDGLFGG